MSLFFADISEDTEITWELALRVLNDPEENLSKLPNHGYVLFFLNLLNSIFRGDSFTLNYDNLDNPIKSFKKKNFLEKSVTPDSLLSLINENKNKSRLILNTSGTTGQPKKITHELESLIKSVKSNSKHQNDVWGLAYNPTHMAGLQVFFQALFNKNPLIRLFDLSRKQIHDSISRYSVTHISATPTYFRMILDRNRSFESVKRITTGGEGCDMALVESLKDMFPNAEFRNIYASTEAGTLFESNSDLFEVKEQSKDKVKIEDGELFIHQDLLAKSMKNNDKFDLWYATGDLVEVVVENPVKFRFIGRKNEMINVGGYKVNPEKVESALNRLEGVSGSRVYSKENRLIGKVVCADVELSDSKVTEKELRGSLQNYLYEYEIPRFYTFVKEIEKTKTGKLKRNV
jgi:acyl-coenzyme A synthetase/AMP-(fatty) acid ligase